jgi:hypothetical protein
MKRLSYLFAALPFFTTLACGGDSKPKPGMTCINNSDCHNPLSCTAGRCHDQCQETRDCPLGARCVFLNNGDRICQLPDEVKCSLNSQCKPEPLVCAKDLQCRNQCDEDRDCNKNQKCIEKVCADMGEFDPATMKLNLPDGGGLPSPDGGAASDAATGGDGPAGSDGSGGNADRGNDAPVGDGSSSSPDVQLPPVTSDPVIVRQGDTVTLTIAGTMLSNPGNFDFGPGMFRVVLEPGATDTMFKIDVQVPHGAAPGPRDFTFTTAGGFGKKEGLLTVSPITAGPMGDDTANRGTTDSPFKTFNKAITVAASGDTIRLLDNPTGYTVASGENWMKPVPDKVTVEGQSADNTKLVGPGALGGGSSVDAFSFLGDATVKNINVGFFRYGVHVSKPGTVTLENVKITGSQADGVYLDYMAVGAKVVITGATTEISGNNGNAIQVSGPGTSVTVMGGVKLQSKVSYAVQFTSGATNASLTVNDATITSESNYAAIYAYSAMPIAVSLTKTTINGDVIFSSAMGSLDITDSTVTEPMMMNRSYTVDFTGKKLTLTNCVLTGSTYGVYQRGESEAIIRGSTFQTYRTSGYYLQTGKLDLGTDVAPGRNKFIGPDNMSAVGLFDARQRAADNVTASFTSFNGNTPSAGTVATGPVNMPPLYRINTTDNKIEFK